MLWCPPRSTPEAAVFPYTTVFRAVVVEEIREVVAVVVSAVTEVVAVVVEDITEVVAVVV
jgi:hypothetical protein